MSTSHHDSSQLSLGDVLELIAFIALFIATVPLIAGWTLYALSNVVGLIPTMLLTPPIFWLVAVAYTLAWGQRLHTIEPVKIPGHHRAPSGTVPAFY